MFISKCLRGTLEIDSGEEFPLIASLTYRTWEPYAVELLLEPIGGSAARWVLGRELLATGLTEFSGEGDVLVRPDPHARLTSLALGRGCDRAVVKLPTEPLHAWLARTFEAVPLGEEQPAADIDEELARWLADI